MGQKAKKILMLSAALAIQLLSSGCLVGGDGLSSFFGGGESSAAFISGPSSNDGQWSGNSGEETNYFSETNPEGSSIDVPPVAVLHNPEPASMILFGSGLAGLGFFRRRRKASK